MVQIHFLTYLNRSSIIFENVVASNWILTVIVNEYFLLQHIYKGIFVTPIIKP